MIRSFADKRTKAVFEDVPVKGLGPDVRRAARKKLLMLDRSSRLADLRVPPGNRLEALHGDRAGQYSIRVNDQWRICFVWRDGDAFNAEITDYHLTEGKEVTVSIPRESTVDYGDLIDSAARPVGPIHPGVVLQEEFLAPLGISAYALAKAISVPRNRITGIIRGERAVTADTALRLARFFGTSPEFWLGLQMSYDLETATTSIGDRLEKEVTPRAA